VSTKAKGRLAFHGRLGTIFPSWARVRVRRTRAWSADFKPKPDAGV